MRAPSKEEFATVPVDENKPVDTKFVTMILEATSGESIPASFCSIIKSAIWAPAAAFESPGTAAGFPVTFLFKLNRTSGPDTPAKVGDDPPCARGAVAVVLGCDPLMPNNSLPV